MDITSFKTEKVKIINRYQAESNSDVIIRFSSIECSQIASAGMYIKIKSKNVLIENLYQIMRVSKINKWLEILCDQNNAELNFSNFVKNNDPIILIGPSDDDDRGGAEDQDEAGQNTNVHPVVLLPAARVVGEFEPRLQDLLARVEARARRRVVGSIL